MIENYLPCFKFLFLSQPFVVHAPLLHSVLVSLAMVLENSHQPFSAPHDNRESSVVKADGNRTELGIGMSNLGVDTQSPFPDGLDRVFPIRSVIGIEPHHSDNQSPPSHDLSTRRGSEGVASFSPSEEPTYELDTPSRTKFAQTTDDHGAPYTTTRFTHRTTADGHMVVINNAGTEKLQRCEVSTI